MGNKQFSVESDLVSLILRIHCFRIRIFLTYSLTKYTNLAISLGRRPVGEMSKLRQNIACMPL